MRVLGISGSYSKEGIVDTAISQVLAGAQSRGAQVGLVRLADLDMAYCRNCRVCASDQGPAPGPCVHDDDVATLLDRCLEADLLVLGSPVNFGRVTALTKTFWERLAVLARWPEEKWIPKLRDGIGNRRAVVVSSSTAPPLLARLGGVAASAELVEMARLLGARRVDRFHLGLVALANDHTLDSRHRQRAFKLGVLSVDGSHLRRKALLARATIDVGGLPTVVRGILEKRI